MAPLSAPGLLELGWSMMSLKRPWSGEDDLAADGLVVEFSDGDDVLYLRNEVVLLEAKQVDRRLAGVQAGAGVGDHLDELGDGGDVELLHPVVHVVRHDRGHARESAEQG